MALPKSSRQCTKPHHKKAAEEWSGNCDLASVNSPDPNPIKHPWDVLSKSLIHGCPGSQSTGPQGSGTSILVPDTSGYPPRPRVYSRVKPSLIHKGASVDHILFKQFINRSELNNAIFQDCFLSEDMSLVLNLILMSSPTEHKSLYLSLISVLNTADKSTSSLWSLISLTSFICYLAPHGTVCVYVCVCAAYTHSHRSPSEHPIPLMVYIPSSIPVRRRHLLSHLIVPNRPMDSSVLNY